MLYVFYILKIVLLEDTAFGWKMPCMFQGLFVQRVSSFQKTLWNWYVLMIWTKQCVYLSIYPSIHPHTHPSIHLSIFLSFYLSIFLSIFLSFYLSIYLSTYLCIYVIYLSKYKSPSKWLVITSVVCCFKVKLLSWHRNSVPNSRSVQRWPWEVRDLDDFWWFFVWVDDWENDDGLLGGREIFSPIFTQTERETAQLYWITRIGSISHSKCNGLGTGGFRHSGPWWLGKYIVGAKKRLLIISKSYPNEKSVAVEML